MSDLLTTKEIAKYLKLRPETVLRKVRRGEIPAVRIGGHFRFDKEEIDEWLRDKSTSKKRILVIDDEENIRQLFKETLEGSGYHVTTAQSGTEALELLNGWNFDLIFVDLKMPGMNGAETFRQIRQIDSSMPVVIITGYPISDLMKQALEQGPFGIMRKPFSALDIQRSAGSFLRGVRAKDRLTDGLQQLGYTLS
ncbi:MAG TPA: response regulator [Dehalococcoidia bacterium]|nr:response regulator [Dehalococcoidia bacterium]